MTRTYPTILSLSLAIVALSSLCGCGKRDTARAARTDSGDLETPRFTDVAAASGIVFQQGHGGRRPLTILETTGSGCAFLDFDNDGWQDIFLVGQPRCALYRNPGIQAFGRSGVEDAQPEHLNTRTPEHQTPKFEEVTAKAGLGREGFWIGCATGDYDNDGDVDLFVSGDKVCALYRNEGNGTFADVTQKAGIHERGWQSSCGFGDVDRDGYLDLYIGRYVHFGPDDIQYCSYQGTSLMVTCGPDAYRPQIGVFYRNNGDGTFTEATRRFGMETAHGKAWGVAFGDFDNDGWQDLYVANDEMLGDLFHNRGGKRMENVGTASGTAVNRDGSVQGGMGVDWGDYDNDGYLDLVVTTFWMEPFSLYRNERSGHFTEMSYPAGIAAPTLKRVGFGARFADFNHDGRLDLYFLNGHVRDASPVNPDEAMPQRMQLFLNQGNGRFREVSEQAGEPFQRLIVGRGAAFGDYDNDGDLDIAVIDSEGSALLLRNDGPPDGSRPRHWLRVRALTAAPARDAMGARVAIEAGGLKQVREVQTGGSFASAHDPRVHFGLAGAERVDRLTLRWPNGKTETFTNLPVDREIVIQEGKGIVPTVP